MLYACNCLSQGSRFSPVSSIALSKSAFSEFEPFSGSPLTFVFSDGTATPETKKKHG